MVVQRGVRSDVVHELLGGYTTDFIEHIDINPALNEAETAYLDAFRQSRRFARRGGPYAVPGNPYLDERDEYDVETTNRVAPGQSGWSI